MTDRVVVSDLFKDGEWINLQIDVGDATICLAFKEEDFQKFREAINKEPYDINQPTGGVGINQSLFLEDETWGKSTRG